MPDVNSKVCSKCKLDLPFSEYSKNESGRHGLRSQCRTCVRAYRESRSEEIAAQQREYRETHKAEIAARNRVNYKANKAKEAARCRAYYEAHRDEAAARRREWRKSNPGKSSDYRHKRRARLCKSTVVQFSQEGLLGRMAYFGNKCWICSGPFEHIDHVKPLSKGGSHMLSNLRPACRSCNSSKSAKWPFTLEDATWLCP